jgi:transcriptional regulator with XRE-family HTH domain
MAKHKKLYDEALFRPGQRKAAHMLLEREFGDKRQRLDKIAIADACGVSRMTLYRWEHEDANFIAYYNHIAQMYTDSQLAFVYSKLLEGIKSGSMKGIELYLKQAGKLVDKQEIEMTDNRETVEERAERLKARLAQMEQDENGADE